MPDGENSKEFSLLSDYTSCLAFYQGEGTLTLSNQQTISCTFEVGQRREGDVFLLCTVSRPDALDVFFFLSTKQRVERFDGATPEGFHLSAAGNVLVMGIQGDQLTCRLQKLSVEMARGIQPHTIHFGITNFVFDKGFSFQLDHAGAVTTIGIQPVEQHSRVIRRVKDLRTIDVTCEAIGFLSDVTNAAELEQVADHLCYLLSVAQGTKIEWIYQDFYDGTGTRLSRLHGSRKTRAYGPLSIFKGDAEIWAFVERTYSTYVTNCERYKLSMGTIDTYLDAKAEDDYLQVRGIKLAVAMEVIKDVFFNLPDSPVEEFVSDPKAFKKLRRALGTAILPILEREHIPLTKQKLDEKLPDLNRRTFADVLDAIFKRIGLQIENEDRTRFIQCRNSLVHRGHFYCETSGQEAPSNEELFREYCFLVSVLDQVFLKLLGYHGGYWDRRSSEQPVYKELV